MTIEKESRYLSSALPCGVALMVLLLANYASRQQKKQSLSEPFAANPAPLPLVRQEPQHRVHVAALHPHPVKKVVLAVLDTNRMNLHPLNEQKYIYTFEGIATYQQQRCPNASILVRVSTANEMHTVGGVTNADGTYSIQVPINAAVNDPIDWVVEGYTPEFQKVEMTGRRIVAKEDDQVTLEQPLAFLR